jgi:hypothetical protein
MGYLIKVLVLLHLIGSKVPQKEAVKFKQSKQLGAIMH